MIIKTNNHGWNDKNLIIVTDAQAPKAGKKNILAKTSLVTLTTKWWIKWKIKGFQNMLTKVIIIPQINLIKKITMIVGLFRTAKHKDKGIWVKLWCSMKGWDIKINNTMKAIFKNTIINMVRASIINGIVGANFKIKIIREKITDLGMIKKLKIYTSINSSEEWRINLLSKSTHCKLEILSLNIWVLLLNFLKKVKYHFIKIFKKDQISFWTTIG